MEIEKTLEDIGLSKGETKIFLALLKLGPSPVKRLKKETLVHRTTIYDFLEKLMNKGLISYTLEQNTKHFKAKEPSELLDYLEEKQEKIKKIIPQLKKIKKENKKKVEIQIYHEKEGLKHLLKDILKTKKEVLGYGIEEKEFEIRIPFFMEQFFKKQKNNKIKEKILINKETKFKYKNKNTSYKTIPQKYFNSSPSFIYGDKIANIIWKPLTIIIIENKELSKTQKNQFNLLWEKAELTIPKISDAPSSTGHPLGKLPREI